MQKTVFAIALALTLSCALAAYTPENFVKPPVPVCNDGDTNFTNQTALTIGSLGLTDLNLISVNGKPVDPQNPSNISFTLWTRKLDNKALTQGANTTYTFTAPLDIDYVNGYVFYFTSAADAANNTQIYVSQVKLDGNTQLPKFALTTNTNSTFKPTVLGGYTAGKTVYVYYQAALRVLNVTSFTAGGSAMGKVFNVTTNFDGNFAVAGGDALSSSQSLAIWNEGDALKEGLIDGSKGTVTLTANPLGGYNKTNQACFPYVTDKKLYGTMCRTIINNTQVQLLVRTNSTNLLPLYTANVSDTTEVTHFPYAGYYAFIYQTAPPKDVQTLTTEIWDLEKFTTFKPRTKFLTYNPNNSTQQIYRVPSGGVFVLLYNNKAQDNATLTGVQAGLLLGSSYLASVFGFLLTIIAGLFLF